MKSFLLKKFQVIQVSVKKTFLVTVTVLSISKFDYDHYDYD